MVSTFTCNGFSPFYWEPNTRGIYFQPPGQISCAILIHFFVYQRKHTAHRGYSQLPDSPKAEKTHCLHFLLLLALGEYFTRFHPVKFCDSLSNPIQVITLALQLIVACILFLVLVEYRLYKLWIAKNPLIAHHMVLPGRLQASFSWYDILFSLNSAPYDLFFYQRPLQCNFDLDFLLTSK